MRMSVSGSSFTISNSFFAGSVSAPAFAIDALHSARRPTSRSVAARRTVSPFASNSTLARIGIVFLRSTMPWNSCSSLSRSNFADDSSMVSCPPGERPLTRRIPSVKKEGYEIKKLY